jgi:oligopeptide/dipeptide ABC transporter ATP-binding protein
MEPLRIHENLPVAEARTRAIAALQEVGISEPERRMESYPHHFSGGMRQRVMLAMAIITNPQLLIADEPTTALDVTVQAQVLNLMDRLRRERNMALLLITHDLGVVANTCDRVVVMYAGNVMETAPVNALFAKPAHPYTRALLKARPSLQVRGATLYTIPGMPPNAYRKPQGCPFAPRCEMAEDRCHVESPELRTVGDGHETACWKG